MIDFVSDPILSLTEGDAKLLRKLSVEVYCVQISNVHKVLGPERSFIQMSFAGQTQLLLHVIKAPM